MALRAIILDFDGTFTDVRAEAAPFADEFRRDTGYLRPGKSEPLEMSSPERDRERAEAWEAWRRERSRKVLADLRAAIAAAGGAS